MFKAETSPALGGVTGAGLDLNHHVRPQPLAVCLPLVPSFAVLGELRSQKNPQR